MYIIVEQGLRGLALDVKTLWLFYLGTCERIYQYILTLKITTEYVQVASQPASMASATVLTLTLS